MSSITKKKIFEVVFIYAITSACALAAYPFNIFAYESGDLVFSEVMYDVPGTDAGYEWIELWNRSDDEVDVSQWFIFENNVAHAINSYPESTSNCNVSPGEYIVITSNAEKFTSAWNDVPEEEICDTVISLNNTGERLEIIAPDQSVIDSIDYEPQETASGTGFSLQFDGSTWGVGEASPGKEAVFGLPETDDQEESDTGNENSEDQDSEEENQYTTDDQTQDALVLDPEEYYESERDHPDYFRPYYTGELITPDAVYYGMPAEFSMDVFFNKFGDDVVEKNEGSILWSFGDASAQRLDWNDPVSHVYHAPGTHIVYASYQTGYSSSKRLEFKKHITVHDVPIEITAIDQYGSITLHNTSKYEVDISLWEIQYGVALFQVPSYTYLPAKEKRVIDRRIHGLPINYYALTHIQLWMPERYKQIASVSPLDAKSTEHSHVEEGQVGNIDEDGIEVKAKDVLIDKEIKDTIEETPEIITESIDYTSLLASIQGNSKLSAKEKGQGNNDQDKEGRISWVLVLLALYCTASSGIGYILYRRMWVVSDDKKDQNSDIKEKQKSTDAEVLSKYLRDQ